MADIWYLVRHPDKAGDVEGIYLGNDARITKRGEEQVRLTAARLYMLGPQRALSSQLPRSVQLAQHIASSLGIHLIQHQLFNEIDKPQSLVGLHRTDPLHVETMRRIREGFDCNRVPKGVQVKRRTELEEETRHAFTLIEGIPTHSVVLVGHAKRIASYVHWVLQGETLKGFYKTDAALKLNTASITTLVREPDRRTGEIRWKVEMVNDTSHLTQGAQIQFAKLLERLESTPLPA